VPLTRELAQNLTHRSDQELLAILASPDDWQPDVVAFAQAELERRSVPHEQIAERLAEVTEQLRLKAITPLTHSEMFLSAVCVLIGCIGIVVVAYQASRFNQDGYTLKARRAWQVYWITAAIVVGFAFAAAFAQKL
jgi:hypothetical protein